MTLPAGERRLETYEEVRAAWGDLLTIPPADPEGAQVDGEPGGVLFAGNPRVAITEGAIYVKLRKPVKAGENVELTDVLRITEPTVQVLRQADRHKTEMEKGIALLAAICGVPHVEIDRMVASDFALCGEVLGAFL